MGTGWTFVSLQDDARDIVSAIGQPQSQEEAASPRPDPDASDLMGPSSIMDLENRDPNRRYVFVSRHKLTTAHYRKMGYRPEVARDGGVSIAGEEVEPGRELESMDHVLMSVSKERHAQIEQKGAFGDGGQARLDEVEKKIIDQRTQNDHFRGFIPRKGGRDYFRVRSETTDLEEET